MATVSAQEMRRKSVRNMSQKYKGIGVVPSRSVSSCVDWDRIMQHYEVSVRFQHENELTPTVLSQNFVSVRAWLEEDVLVIYSESGAFSRLYHLHGVSETELTSLMDAAQSSYEVSVDDAVHLYALFLGLANNNSNVVRDLLDTHYLQSGLKPAAADILLAPRFCAQVVALAVVARLRPALFTCDVVQLFIDANVESNRFRSWMSQALALVLFVSICGLLAALLVANGLQAHKGTV